MYSVKLQAAQLPLGLCLECESYTRHPVGQHLLGPKGSMLG